MTTTTTLYQCFHKDLHPAWPPIAAIGEAVSNQAIIILLMVAGLSVVEFCLPCIIVLAPVAGAMQVGEGRGSGGCHNSPEI